MVTLLVAKLVAAAKEAAKQVAVANLLASELMVAPMPRTRSGIIGRIRRSRNTVAGEIGHLPVETLERQLRM